MHPADTARTSARPIRPLYESKSFSTCQPSTDGRGSAFSRAIILLNFEPVYRDGLELTLRACRYKVFIPEEHGKPLSELRDEELRQADLIIFDVTRINHDTWSQLRRICRVRKPDGLPLMVLCWLRGDRGPDFHLLVEKLGARFVYAK